MLGLEDPKGPKHGTQGDGRQRSKFSTEPFSVSAYVGSSKSLKNLKDWNVIRKEEWLFCRTSSGVRLWELEEPKGPKGSLHLKDLNSCLPKGVSLGYVGLN